MIKYPDKSNFGENQLILAHNSWAQFNTAEKTRWQEQNARRYCPITPHSPGPKASVKGCVLVFPHLHVTKTIAHKHPVGEPKPVGSPSMLYHCVKLSITNSWHSTELRTSSDCHSTVSNTKKAMNRQENREKKRESRNIPAPTHLQRSSLLLVDTLVEHPPNKVLRSTTLIRVHILSGFWFFLCFQYLANTRS